MILFSFIIFLVYIFYSVFFFFSLFVALRCVVIGTLRFSIIFTIEFFSIFFVLFILFRLACPYFIVYWKIRHNYDAEDFHFALFCLTLYNRIISSFVKSFCFSAYSIFTCNKSLFLLQNRVILKSAWKMQI